MSQFCPTEEKNQRCVLYINHAGPHDLKPKSSLSVRKIEDLEKVERRLGDRNDT